MNDPHDQAAELRLTADLAELHGRGMSADLPARLQARLADLDAHRQLRAARPSRLLAALVLGSGLAAVAVAAALAWRDRTAAPERAAATQPQGQEGPQGKPKPDAGKPDSGKPDAGKPSAEAPLEQRVATWLKDLELPERRAAGLAGFQQLGQQRFGLLRVGVTAGADAATLADFGATKEQLAKARERAKGTHQDEVLAALQWAEFAIDTAPAKQAFGLPPGPVTLVADYSDNRIVAVDAAGLEVFERKDVFGAWDACLCPDGTMLVTEFSVSRVQRIDGKGKVVWAYEHLKNPYRAELLPSGNVMITDTFGNRVIEVTPTGQVAWELLGIRDQEPTPLLGPDGKPLRQLVGMRPFGATRLANGNTLVADVLKDRVVELASDGALVWEQKGTRNVHDAKRLPNGNTLATLRAPGEVKEYDAAGKVVWQLKQLSSPTSAERLPDGHTLVAENTRVAEYDAAGKRGWTKEMTWAVQARRY